MRRLDEPAIPSISHKILFLSLFLYCCKKTKRSWEAICHRDNQKTIKLTKRKHLWILYAHFDKYSNLVELIYIFKHFPLADFTFLWNQELRFLWKLR